MLAVLGSGLAHGLVLHGSVVAPRPSCLAVDMKLHDDGVLGVGLIGAGRIGLVHFEALNRNPYV